MLDTLLRIIKKFIPRKLFTTAQPLYHYCLAFLGAVIYRFPSRHITVIGITGTKGKTTTAEVLSSILENAGYKTAVTNTIRFKIGNNTSPNKYKMSMPGRFFMQKFLRKAVRAGCTHAVIEMTSEGAKFYRHKYIYSDMLVFTNLSPEHIESHGSYEKYRDAKLSIALELSISKKSKTTIVVNADDPESERFLAYPVSKKVRFSLRDVTPQDASSFTWGSTHIAPKIPGVFNIYNLVAAATAARELGVSEADIVATLGEFDHVRGRVEFIKEGQDYDVIVDYAHTPDSLEKLYKTFDQQRKICVLGNTGGGRDVWKRPEMAKIAETHCDHIILTNEDPYDEDPKKIIKDMADAILDHEKLETILDRRQAIARALRHAKKGDAVLITGKGTDPYIMGADGKKYVWDDATVAREELEKLGPQVSA